MDKFLDGLITAMLMALSLVLIGTALVMAVCVVLFVFEQSYRFALQYGVIAFVLMIASFAMINFEGNR